MTRTLEPRKVMDIEEMGMNLTAAGTDCMVRAFAEWAEARVAKWIQFPRGVLLFLMVPGDLESGWFYLLDRVGQTVYRLDIAGDGRWGGYREDEFEPLVESLGLKRLAERPREIRALLRNVF